MIATVATSAPCFSEYDLGADINNTIQQNQEEAARFVFDETWSTLDLSINTGWPSVGWMFASTGSVEGFSYFSFEAMAREAVWRVSTNYHESFREQRQEDTREHLKAVRDELLKAVKIFDDAIADPIGATQAPDFNPLSYATDEQIEQMKIDCGGSEYPFNSKEPDSA